MKLTYRLSKKVQNILLGFFILEVTARSTTDTFSFQWLGFAKANWYGAAGKGVVFGTVKLHSKAYSIDTSEKKFEPSLCIPIYSARHSENKLPPEGTMLNSVAHRTQVAGLTQATIAGFCDEAAGTVLNPD